MSDLAKIVGQRIRNYRNQRGISQEKLAELSDYHPTYIGQLERGEKNATLESINKVCMALKVPISQLLENLGGEENRQERVPLACYELLLSKSKDEQDHIFKILLELDEYKNK